VVTPGHDLVHRAIGAFVGLAVGDALGAPFEFKPPGSYTRRFPEPVVGGIGEMIGGGPWGPGEFTDDSQMAVMVAESLLACGGVDQADLGRRFKAWAASDPKDIGLTTREALWPEVDPKQAAADHFAEHPDHSAGNGSLMRTIPAAVRFAGEGTEATMAAARAISELTHGDPATGEGCAIYHELVRAALAGADPLAITDDAVQLIPGDQRERFAEVLAEDWTPKDGPPNGTVWGALGTAVWAIRRSDSYEEAVVRAIDSGDDANTVGAITGGLAGAIWGAGRIPSRWATYVRGHLLGRTYALSDLQDLARRLIGASPVPLADDEPTLAPAEVRPGVWVTNLPGAKLARPETAVISLCRPKGYVDDHEVRREIYLVDQAGDHNPGLTDVLHDVLQSIAAFREAGMDVLIHCHGGRSRTGLVLRAWLQRSEGLSYEAALDEAQRLWPATSTYNQRFEVALRDLVPRRSSQ
jgi:ADP-ribosyl-[dinitrogen reductase] hydrolase